MFIANDTTGVLLDDDGDTATFGRGDRVTVRGACATPADLRALADFLEGTTEATETSEAAEAGPGLPPGQYLRLANVPDSVNHNGELPCDAVDVSGDIRGTVWPIPGSVVRDGRRSYLRAERVETSCLGGGYADMYYETADGLRSVLVHRRHIISVITVH